jgi:hypothetical protein
MSSRPSFVDDRTERDMAVKLLRNLTSIMESKIHETVLSCARARHQTLKTILTTKPTVH